MKARRAFSYARFSTPKQADGFSLARQLEAAERYCERNGLTLDERTFSDEGMSGFHGSNAVAGELAEFIRLANDGRVPKGSVLIIENVDRLSRLPPDKATAIIMELVNAGIEVVTISPEQRYTKENIHTVGVWVPLQVAIVLAREESEKKSGRLKDAHARKRAALAEGVKYTKAGPFWLKLSADRKTWIIKEREAKLMRDAFRWCTEGLGAAKICEKFHEEYPEGVTGKGWQPNNIRKLLRSRQAIGEYQAVVGTCAKRGGVKSTRRKAGPPVIGYFPAIVTEAEFYKAQQALDGRKKGGGRSTGSPNLFNGILYDAYDQMRMVINRDRRGRILVSSGAIRKMAGSQFRSIPYTVFERGVLDLLRELKPADVMGKAGPGEDAVELWSGKLAAVNHNITQTTAKAATAIDPDVFLGLLDEYGKQRKEIIANLEAAKADASSPASDALGECTSLVWMMEEAEGDEKDELRRRVKSALRRLVSDIWVLIVPRGRERVIGVQVNFRGGSNHRRYVICHRPIRADKSGTYPGCALTLSWEGSVAFLPEDISTPKGAKAVEKYLQKVPYEMDPEAGKWSFGGNPATQVGDWNSISAS